MSLGNNRDYKTTHNRAARNLRIHKLIFEALLLDGMERTAADNLAYAHLVARDQAYRDACKCLGIPAKRPRKVAGA